MATHSTIRKVLSVAAGTCLLLFASPWYSDEQTAGRRIITVSAGLPAPWFHWVDERSQTNNATGGSSSFSAHWNMTFTNWSFLMLPVGVGLLMARRFVRPPPLESTSAAPKLAETLPHKQA